MIFEWIHLITGNVGHPHGEPRHVGRGRDRHGPRSRALRRSRREPVYAHEGRARMGEAYAHDQRPPRPAPVPRLPDLGRQGQQPSPGPGVGLQEGQDVAREAVLLERVDPHRKGYYSSGQE